MLVPKIGDVLASSFRHRYTKIEEKADLFVDERWKHTFKRDAENVRRSRAILLVGIKGTIPHKPERPIKRGACGYPNCNAFIKAKKMGNNFASPLCVFEVLDLGIALRISGQNRKRTKR